MNCMECSVYFYTNFCFSNSIFSLQGCKNILLKKALSRFSCFVFSLLTNRKNSNAYFDFRILAFLVKKVKNRKEVYTSPLDNVYTAAVHSILAYLF